MTDIDRFESRGTTPARTSEDLPQPEAPRTRMKASPFSSRRRVSALSTRWISWSRPKRTAASFSSNGSSPGYGRSGGAKLSWGRKCSFSPRHKRSHASSIVRSARGMSCVSWRKSGIPKQPLGAVGSLDLAAIDGVGRGKHEDLPATLAAPSSPPRCTRGKRASWGCRARPPCSAVNGDRASSPSPRRPRCRRQGGNPGIGTGSPSGAMPRGRPRPSVCPSSCG